MSEWKRVKLSDVCEIPITDGTHQTPTYASESEGIPFLSSKDVTSQSIDWQNIKYITKDLHEVLYKRIAPKKDDVLLAKNGTTGVAALVEDDRVFDIYVTLALLRPKQNIVYPKYLLRVINSPFCKRQFDSHLKGIGVPNLHLKEINETKIPLPPLEEQKRIAAVLDKCTEIIAKRKAQLSALDELIKARFVEMFGDPVKNPKGWKIQCFEKLSELITDGEHATPRRVDKGIYLLSARNVLNHAIQLKDVDYIDQNEYERISKRIIPQEGDILISCSGSVGRCCSVPAGLKFQMVRSAALIRFKKDILPKFAEYMIVSDYVQQQIEASKTASSQANLFQGKIAKLMGFVPPIELQKEFSDFVAQVDKTKLAIQKSLEKTQLLFDSLMQEYFG